MHQSLVRTYFEKTQDPFMGELHDWFDNQNIEKFDNNGKSQFSDLKIDQLPDEQFSWNQGNIITFTPAIIKNGFHFSEQYDRSDLIHFINDLEDDEEF